MTMLSFRIDEDDARSVQEWAERLGIDRSELLREALHSHLVRLAIEQEPEAFAQQPFTDEEASLDQADDWGPAEDWSDWGALDAPR